MPSQFNDPTIDSLFNFQDPFNFSDPRAGLPTAPAPTPTGGGGGGGGGTPKLPAPAPPPPAEALPIAPDRLPQPIVPGSNKGLPVPVSTTAPPASGGGGGSAGSGGVSGNEAAAAGFSSANTPLLDQTVENQLAGGLSQDEIAFRDTIRQMLLDQLAGAQEIPNINDPVLAAQQQAFERAQQRQFERFQNQAAERFSTQGLLNSGARNVADEGFQQFQGESAAANAAGLVGQDLLRRREELMNLLNLSVGVQDADLTRDLQERLVAIDAELQRSLGFADLDLRGQLGNRSLDIQKLLGLGNLSLGRAGLDQDLFKFITDDAFRRENRDLGVLGG